ncbi:uncharacterized protein LOC132903569 [Amyelois transitella]|uniref:uncharacterized protein LOC132903569 n=1 Tax=Amyelois transitella TaxID=680683 RepID=UPI002990321A|nr:uncharacterized protein LOC132903569 [Amyelois transitella]
MSQLPPLESLDCDGDPSSVGLRWEKWKRALELYLTATNIKSPETKRAILLHMGGLSLQEIYYNIPGAHVDKAPEDNSGDIYTIALAKLDEYFSPKQSRVYERHLFRLIKQEAEEKFEKFLVRLRNQSAKCKFQVVEEHLIDQITEKCESVELRKKILTLGDDVTLDKIISEANALEAVQRQLKGFDASKVQLAVNHVNKSFSKKETPDPCCRCGGNHPSNEKSCPALLKKCLKCGYVGHFRRYCKTSKKKRKFNDITSGTTTVAESSTKKIKTSKPAEDVHYIFQIDGDDTIVCTLGGVNIDMLIDSGSKCNIINDATWENLKSLNIIVKNQVKSPQKNFVAYGSQNPLTVLGAFDSSIVISNGCKLDEETFYVVKGGTKNLLGKDTAIKLGVLRVGLGINMVNTKFPKFKDVKITIPIDETIKPVSQPCRRIPVPLESKINDKIQELLDADIIEPVNGPSDWVSPLVPVLKENGDARVCLDMRQANKAIIREKHPLPTMEQLLPKFRNAKMFSKLDIKNAFHQIELSEDCRYITTFICNRGLFRYKRLMFGISCAPEIFQKTLEKILLPCEGVVNFIDDIVVFGSDSEHGERLKKLLQVLKDNNVILNEGKCTFSVRQIQFLGHQLSCNGVKPLDKYVSLIQSFREPKVIEEVQSFLGLVNYVGKWIPHLATLTDPLRELLRLKLSKGANISSHWQSKQSKAFAMLKKALNNIHTLGYYNPQDRTQVFADASPVGLGAVLVQHGVQGPRIIAYAITLTELSLASEADTELQLVKKGVFNSNWDQSVTNYKIFEHELCFQDNILLRQNKIVIPTSLRLKVLASAHEGHPGRTPAELFFRRQFRDKLPSLLDVEFADCDQETRDRDTEMKSKGKEYADRKRQAKETDIQIGEKVYTKNLIKENKLSTTFNNVPYTVTKQKGNDMEIENEETGQRLRRNVVHLKRVEGKWEVCNDGNEEHKNDSDSENISVDNN